MGVYHISGLGRSPGAVTMPLTCVYCLLKLAYEENDQMARGFFSSSGEFSQNEKYAGKPEGLIVISTEEIFDDPTKVIGFTCKWFELNLSVKSNKNVISVYLKKLTEILQLQYQPLPLKYFCGIRINNISDLDDIFLKSYITMMALRDKEVWINLVGGANHINFILIISASLALASTRFYYVFDWDETQDKSPTSLHPTWFGIRNLNAKDILSRWYEVPPVIIGWSEVIGSLRDIFVNTDIVNIGQIRDLLRNLVPEPDKLIPKLRGVVLNIDGEKVSLTQMFKRFLNLTRQAEEQGIKNLSDLLRWKDTKVFLRND